jgi:hypothetical protein
MTHSPVAAEYPLGMAGSLSQTCGQVSVIREPTATGSWQRGQTEARVAARQRACQSLAARGAQRRPRQAAAQPRPLIFCASAKSFAVRPPAECVDSVSVTLFHWIRMSG